METDLVSQLKASRSRLIKSYAVHVIWFLCMIVTAALHARKLTIATSVWLALLTVPPVLYYTIKVHTLSRLLDPKSGTVGLFPVILTTLFLTPFESGLILPAKNILASAKVIRNAKNPASRP